MLQPRLGTQSMNRRQLGNSPHARIAVTLAIAALILFVLIPFTAAAPDVPSVEWSQIYPGLRPSSVIQTSDGGYAIAGIATASGASTLIKTDSSGNVQWQQNVGAAVSVVQTSDLGYVVFCLNGVIIKTDADGNSISSFSVGVVGVQKGIVFSNETYILVGNSNDDSGDLYAWLRRVDAQGKILWNNNYTGGVYVSTVVKTVDRGCALAGNWKTDFWLAKLDSNGNQQWSQTFAYGDVLDDHFVYDLIGTKDGGFLLAGTGHWQSSNGMIPWLVKIDSQGHEQWNLPYGQYSNDSFRAVVQASDEGHLLYQPRNATLTRTDSSGSELWHIQLGFASPTPSSSLILTKDGGYALAGTTSGRTFLVKISPEADLQAPALRISSPLGKTYETSNVSLTFTVDRAALWFGYSLDGQQNETLTGNTTLTGLAVGVHNVTIYARGIAGLEGKSDTIRFTVAARFPTELVLACVAIAVVACISFLLYVKRKKLADYRKQGLRTLVKRQNLAAVTSNRLAWTLIIISLCFILAFVQIFFPYLYYSTPITSKSSFEVGITYVYEQDSAQQIYSEVSRIKDLGFSVIRVNLVCNSIHPSDYVNTLSEVFFSAASQLGMNVALIINNHATYQDINFYLDRWGASLVYIQILNEPDVASSWDIGALFTDDEAGSAFDQIYSTVEQHQLPALLYTNFGPAFLVRTNLPVQFSQKLDFVGFDVFMDSFLTLSPNMIQLLHKITNKDVVITEYGMSTSDDQAQSDFILRGLNLFKNMGLRCCWIVYWNSANNNYGIRGRLAEKTVGEWIAQNS